MADNEGTIHISVSTVRNDLSKFVDCISDIVGEFEKIQGGYIDGTEAVWNTPVAHTFISSVTGSFNDYIGQFNQYFDEGYDRFLTNANELFRSQNADQVEKQDLEKIVDLSVNWTEASDDFNVPVEYGSFTTNNFTTYVNEIITNLNTMNDCITDAVENGMSGEFCAEIQASIDSLIKSATSVAEDYDSTTAKNAVDEDEVIQSLRSGSAE